MAIKKRATYRHEMANAICGSETFASKLLYHQTYDTFFLYGDERYYKQLTPHDVRTLFLRFIEAKFGDYNNVDMSLIENIIELSKYKLPKNISEEDGHLIAFKDVLLNTKTMETEEKNREKIATLYVPYDYCEVETPIPNFLRFIETSLVFKDYDRRHDEALGLLAQEMFGMMFLDDLRASMAFFLLGTNAANGKSTMCYTLQNIIGKNFCSHLSISDLGDKFSTHYIIGKRVNISGEEDDKFVRSKIFKALVSGDFVKGERKYGEVFSFRPKTKYVFSTNKMPTFDGLDAGLRRRMMILPFYRTFSPKERDVYLEDKLKMETPGIIGWALRGAKRLIANNYEFTKSIQVDTVMDEFEEDMSSCIRFIREEYEPDELDFYSFKELYLEYKDWCKDFGYKAKNKNSFSVDLNKEVRFKKGRKSNERGLYCVSKIQREKNDRIIKESFSF
jgi:P4 family phage/plasmid primase-like protien